MTLICMTPTPTTPHRGPYGVHDAMPDAPARPVTVTVTAPPALPAA